MAKLNVEVQGNRIKKELILKNLRKKLEGWEQKRIAFENSWPEYQQQLREYVKKYSEQVEAATSFNDWSERLNSTKTSIYYMPRQPEMHWGYREAVRKIPTQIAAVEAIEGDFVELGDLIVKKKISLAEVFGVEEM